MSFAFLRLRKLNSDVSLHLNMNAILCGRLVIDIRKVAACKDSWTGTVVTEPFAARTVNVECDDLQVSAVELDDL